MSVAEIVFAAAASHAPGLTGWFDKAGPDEQAVLGQLARLLVGNAEQAGSSAAATALVSSLLAGERQ